MPERRWSIRANERKAPTPPPDQPRKPDPPPAPPSTARDRVVEALERVADAMDRRTPGDGRVTRVEVYAEPGVAYTAGWGGENAEGRCLLAWPVRAVVSYQDDGRTLKIFLKPPG